jgi:hypothetical protein
MTREDIVRMGAESKISLYSLGKEKEKFINYLERFAALVASAEREACVQIIENEAMQYAEPVWAFEIVNGIKARGQA